MPTASGRETAQEKRDRQHRERWAKINAAVEALPDGWAEAEARAIVAEDAQLRASIAPVWERAKREYLAEPEAVAVSRALEALTGGRVFIRQVFQMLTNAPVTYRVEAPR